MADSPRVILIAIDGSDFSNYAVECKYKYIWYFSVSRRDSA